MACGLFDPKPILRRPVIILKEVIEEGGNYETLALAAVDKGKQIALSAVESLKRGRPTSPSTSRKKLKMLTGSAGESPLSSLKK